MFYSETLLSKTGPLARVWLSANLERKLSKTHILQSNIETSVDAIVGQDQAPMALRLSGQLLLGVVRIYSRKARYLLEDCNEALMKIKMAFRPGNVDLPAGATAHSAAQLTLPDAITEFDLLLPDPTLELEDLELGDLLNNDPKHRARNKITLDDDESMLMHSQLPRGTNDQMLMDADDDMGLDLGQNPLATSELDIEMGRDAQPDMPDDFSVANITGLDGLDQPSKAPAADETIMEDLDLDLGLDDDLGMNNNFNDFGAGDADTTVQPAAHSPTPQHEQRDATAEATPAPADKPDSPLTSPRPTPEPAAEPADTTFRPVDSPRASEEPSHHPALSRKRKVVIDPITELKAKQIKAQQADRTRILRDPSFLPRDPTVLALMSLTRTGALAHSVFHPRHLAPELADLLAPDFLKRMADAKRKREGEVEESPAKHPRLELESHELPLEELEHHDLTLPEPPALEAELLDLPTMNNDDELPTFRHSPTPEQAEPLAAPSPQREPSPPPMNPEDISRETRHAVHLLREKFAEEGTEKVVFQELLPPKQTAATDATKLFFEVLVLATKDAVSVRQEGGLGGRIEVRGKEGLWGEGAEVRDEIQVMNEREEAAGRRTEVIVGNGRA